jgi:hypothetical protein
MTLPVLTCNSLLLVTWVFGWVSPVHLMPIRSPFLLESDARRIDIVERPSVALLVLMLGSVHAKKCHDMLMAYWTFSLLLLAVENYLFW